MLVCVNWQSSGRPLGTVAHLNCGPIVLLLIYINNNLIRDNEITSGRAGEPASQPAALAAHFVHFIHSNGFYSHFSLLHFSTAPSTWLVRIRALSWQIKRLGALSNFSALEAIAERELNWWVLQNYCYLLNEL